MSKKRGSFLYCMTFVLLVALDRVSKSIVLSKRYLDYKITNFLTFDLSFNRGISWGLLDSQNTGIFVFVSGIIVVITLGLAIYGFIRWRQGKLVIGEVIAIAGSTSNIIDRISYGGVVDFISLSFGRYTWPVFNIADACIVIGIFVMIFYSWLND